VPIEFSRVITYGLRMIFQLPYLKASLSLRQRNHVTVF
jgi:hypothetical protein